MEAVNAIHDPALCMSRTPFSTLCSGRLTHLIKHILILLLIYGPADASPQQLYLQKTIPLIDCIPYPPWPKTQRETGG